jgi:4-hydroxy-tetrahydrodipicolinate synthase
VKETIRACELYHEYGARAVAIVSPFYYKLSPESVYAYFREIALNSPIDVTLYNIPMFASPIDVPTLTRLAEFDKVIGIKDSTGDVAFMCRMMQAVKPIRQDFSFLTGWDVVLMPMLVMGVDGGTNASSGIVPELTRRLWDLVTANRLDEARPLQMRILEVFDAMLYSADFPEGFRAAVELRGFSFGRSRQPLSELQSVDRLALQKVLQCILADFGVVDAPEEGCVPRSGNLERDKVMQVTEAVMAKLRGRGGA